MSYPVLFILGFLSGSLIKLTDDIEDRDLASKQYAVPCGLAYGLLMGYLMLIDTDAALLFGGIIIGNLVTGKIDSTGHYFGLGAILAVLFLYGVKLSPLVLPIAALAALDELRGIIRVPRSLDFIFGYRLILKLGILMLVVLQIVGLNALIILLAFDTAYMLTDGLTRRFSHDV